MATRLTGVLIAIAFVSGGCSRPPVAVPKVTYKASVKLSNGTTREVTVGIASRHSFGAEIKPVSGLLFHPLSLEKALDDGDPGQTAVVSQRFYDEAGLKMHSCVIVQEMCASVIGILPNDLEPQDIDIWTTADLVAMSNRIGEAGDKDGAIREKAREICANEAQGTAGQLTGGPIIPVGRFDPDVPYFDAGLTTREGPETWYVLQTHNNDLLRAVNEGRWSIPAKGHTFAKIEPKFAACITASRRAIEGRTVSWLGTSRPSEPVYAVLWRVEVRDWHSRRTVAAKNFSDSPPFRDAGGLGPLRFQNNDVKQYGDPSERAIRWIRSVAIGSP